MKVRIAFNEMLGEKFFRLRMVAPQRFDAEPGQFVMVRVSEYRDPFLPRPFSIADVNENRVDVIYEVRGRGTGILSRWETGTELLITGPLGNSFPFPEQGESVIIVAGGIGIPPLYFFTKRLIKKGFQRRKIFFFYGARTGESLILKNELKEMGVNLFFSTDDGSEGFHGLITDLLIDEIGDIPLPARAYAVGPNAMMSGVVEITRNLRIPSYVSLETTMACGIGICLGCTVKPKEKYFRKLGYLKVCKDGPVFPGDYFF